MKILSFNAALLDFRIMGLCLLRPTNYIENRLAAMPAKLADTSADIICLQEVYGDKNKRVLTDSLTRVYPYCFHQSKHYGLSLDNGLMIFSKLPFVATHFELFKHQPFEERWLSKKAILTVVVPYKQTLIGVTNMHTTASGLSFQQSSNRIEALRQTQIEQTFAVATRIKTAYHCAASFVCGDFNCGPQVAQANYTHALKQGFIDLYAQANDIEQPTWDTDNILNQESPVFKSSPKQRIDFIFGDKTYQTVFKQLKTSIVFQEPFVKIGRHKHVPLSDHYGVFVELA